MTTQSVPVTDGIQFLVVTAAASCSHPRWPPFIVTGSVFSSLPASWRTVPSCRRSRWPPSMASSDCCGIVLVLAACLVAAPCIDAPCSKWPLLMAGGTHPMWCGVGPLPTDAQRWQRVGRPSSRQTNRDCCCWRQTIYLLLALSNREPHGGDWIYFCFIFGHLRKTHTQAIEYPHMRLPLTSLLI